MSKRRRSSVSVQDRELGWEKGPNGRRLCRFCRIEVPPNRKTFCSSACIHNWKLRSNGKYLRKFLYERDLGKCALCKKDTRYQKIRIEDAAFEAKSRSSLLWEKDSSYIQFLKNESLTVKEAKKTLWQADHIIPVSFGGGECGLEGYRTLCLKCHKGVSKKLSSFTVLLKNKSVKESDLLDFLKMDEES